MFSSHVMKPSLSLLGVGFFALMTAACSHTPVQTSPVETSNNTTAQANTKSQVVQVHAVSAQGVGEAIGTVTFQNTVTGLKITPKLTKLTPGAHGFHIHEKGSCEPAEKDGVKQAALAAGGHFNPNSAPNHGTPNTGHLGDLPVLQVDAAGNASTPVIAPRLTLQTIQGLSVMVHAGGDNYSDQPKPLGGGGERVACGVISSN